MLKVIYDGEMSYDGGRGGLRVLSPTSSGYINYNFVHSVVPEKNCDIWRMSVVNAADREGKMLFQLTKDYAEWEMAIRLADRPDFIGGFNHGDEKEESMTLWIDGEEIAPESISCDRAFHQMEMMVSSVGYDPAEPSTAVLRHQKHFTVTEAGIRLEQEIRWLGSYRLDDKFRSYLAMMPPLKHQKSDPERILTDSYQMEGKDPSPIESLPVTAENTKEICVFGEKNGYAFTMKVEGFEPLYPSSYFAILTDNGGRLNYHKMYIAFAGGSGETVSADTVWRATTYYSIQEK